MSEATREHHCDVTNFYCPDCEQACTWTKGAKRADFDDSIKVLTFDHYCNCENKIHDLDKIYPIVKIGDEVSRIILAS